MITTLYIDGYKSIKHQAVPLRPINLLIGGNGVGKSNFIAVFSLLRAVYEGNLGSYVLKKGGADNLLFFGKKETEKINVTIEFGDKEGNTVNRFQVFLGEAQDELYIMETLTAFNSYGTWYSTIYEENKKESNFRNINHGQAFWVNGLLQEFQVYHFHDTSDSSPIKSPSHIDDTVALRKDGSNIAAFLLHLQKTHFKHYLRIQKMIQSIAPFFGAFVLNPTTAPSPQVKLAWKEKGNYDKYFDAYSLSDGTLRFICLATLLMQPNPPRTIIIDEPELGLHPVAIKKLAALMDLASSKTQLIVSTQSVDLLNEFEAEDVIVTDRSENATVFHRLEEEELKTWIEEYTMGEIWQKNIIGGQPFNL
ncbi:MAG: AAA family ATPase [Aureispira sp.]